MFRRSPSAYGGFLTNSGSFFWRESIGPSLATFKPPNRQAFAFGDISGSISSRVVRSATIVAN
jgi:hypothetical protein